MSDANLLTNLTADIVVSMVANNAVGVNDLPNLITSVHDALVALGKDPITSEPEFTGSTTVRRSLSDPNKIISMIDGKPYSMLKRHLGQNGLTPAEYRARYNLPSDYPMTAPGYSEKRKELALRIGLGRKKPVIKVTSKPVVSNRARKPKAPVA